MRLGVDFSQWGGPLSPSTIDCWKAQGVDHAVVQYSAQMPQHLNVLLAHDELHPLSIEVEAYVYLYWGQSPWGQTPQDRTRAVLRMIQGYSVKRLWLDCEDQTHSFRADQLDECVAVCEAVGMPTGIYTGGWWWKPSTSNSTRYSHLPLWDARYLGEAPTPDLSKMPKDLSGSGGYGGWKNATIHQWWNTTTLCGHSVDLNALADTAPAPTPTPEEETMQPVWAALKDPPQGIPFRSYELYSTPTGLKARHVKTEAEHKALMAARTAGAIKFVSLETLRTFGATPDPLDP